MNKKNKKNKHCPRKMKKPKESILNTKIKRISVKIKINIDN